MFRFTYSYRMQLLTGAFLYDTECRPLHATFGAPFVSRLPEGLLNLRNLSMFHSRAFMYRVYRASSIASRRHCTFCRISITSNVNCVSCCRSCVSYSRFFSRPLFPDTVSPSAIFKYFQVLLVFPAVVPGTWLE